MAEVKVKAPSKKVMCECGVEVIRGGLSRHKKTARHLKPITTDQPRLSFLETKQKLLKEVEDEEELFAKLLSEKDAKLQSLNLKINEITSLIQSCIVSNSGRSKIL